MNDDKQKCPYCGGTGTHDGEICLCVWSARDREDLPEEIVDLFGEVIPKTGKRRK
ncbi:MAG: hypothetical protein WC294_08190 [Methanoregula sp.]|jgi:hypothetical protein